MLDLLASTEVSELHGYEISRRTGIASGTLYPLLMRLADRGMLESRWELPGDGRRPRHLYRITPDGVEAATTAASGPARPHRSGVLGSPA